ncbi:MAG: Nif3-like dinuclear metal center hexameric protein [Desulfotignum sp.]
MNPTVRQMIGLIDSDIAPWNLAEPWDNCGLIAGHPDWPVKKVLVGLDADMPLLEAARQWQADMVLTHHPLFITPVKTIDFSVMPGSAIVIAATKKIAVVCAHTNLDKAADGLNDDLARRLQIQPTRILAPDTDAVTPGGQPAGLGRVGAVSEPLSLARMADQIKRHLGANPVRVVGNTGMKICEAAVCSGSGGSLIPAFLASGADVYITGDIKYHEARLIESQGRALIDVGHFASEIIAKELLARQLEKAALRAGFSLEIQTVVGETDPFVSI